MKIRNEKLPLITTASFLHLWQYREFSIIYREYRYPQGTLYVLSGEAYKKLDTLAIDRQDGVSP